MSFGEAAEYLREHDGKKAEEEAVKKQEQEDLEEQER